MPFRTALIALALSLAFASGAQADEVPPQSIPDQPITFVDRVMDGAQSSVVLVQDTLERALDLIGIRYKRGGTSPESGFDCSGFVGHVFKEGLGLYLPRSSKEMSKVGETVKKTELQPGDLVFFNTMRRTFSHVGIYLGDNKFVHAPRSGMRIRVEDMNESYWRKRFNGARRVGSDD